MARPRLFPNGSKTMPVVFDSKEVERLQASAKRMNISFAAIVRKYVELGEAAEKAAAKHGEFSEN